MESVSVSFVQTHAHLWPAGSHFAGHCQCSSCSSLNKGRGNGPPAGLLLYYGLIVNQCCLLSGQFDFKCDRFGVTLCCLSVPFIFRAVYIYLKLNTLCQVREFGLVCVQHDILFKAKNSVIVTVMLCLFSFLKEVQENYYLLKDLIGVRN